MHLSNLYRGAAVSSRGHENGGLHGSLARSVHCDAALSKGAPRLSMFRSALPNRGAAHRPSYRGNYGDRTPGSLSLKSTQSSAISPTIEERYLSKKS